MTDYLEDKYYSRNLKTKDYLGKGALDKGSFDKPTKSFVYKRKFGTSMKKYEDYCVRQAQEQANYPLNDVKVYPEDEDEDDDDSDDDEFTPNFDHGFQDEGGNSELAKGTNQLERALHEQEIKRREDKKKNMSVEDMVKYYEKLKKREANRSKKGLQKINFKNIDQMCKIVEVKDMDTGQIIHPAAVPEKKPENIIKSEEKETKKPANQELFSLNDDIEEDGNINIIESADLN